MKQTKIEWCDTTINPVVGCPRGCEYCYARRMNGRKLPWSISDFSKPEFRPYALKALKSKKPKSIFMNSMSDIEFWSNEQANFVYDAIVANPQHRYIFLTKGSKTMTRRDYIFNGMTITSQNDIKNIHGNIDFLSIEPILEPIYLLEEADPNRRASIETLKVVILGAETGNRKGRIIPQKEWLDDIVAQCDSHGISVFMKNSLKQLMGADFRQDTLPWQDGGGGEC